jgi:hypothetical protein
VPRHDLGPRSEDGRGQGKPAPAAHVIQAARAARLTECGLARPPDTTRIVDGQDRRRPGTEPHPQVDCLGATLRPRVVQQRNCHRGGVGELSSGGARRQAAAPSAAHLAPPDSPAPGRYGAIPLPCAAGRGGRRAVLSVSEGAGAAACQPDVEGVGEAEVPAAQGTQGADGPLERRHREAATAVVCTLAARDGGRMCLMGAV